MIIPANDTAAKSVVFAGVDCDKVYMNTELVFEKAPAESMITVAYYNGFYGYSNDDAGEFGKITNNIVHGYGGVVKVFQWGGTFYDDRVILDLELADPLISVLRITLGSIVVDLPLRSSSATLSGGTSYSSNSPFANAPKSGTHTIKFEAIA